MTVERGQGSGTLTCVVVLDDASTVTVGVLSIADGKGSWGGPLGPEPGPARIGQAPRQLGRCRGDRGDRVRASR